MNVSVLWSVVKKFAVVASLLSVASAVHGFVEHDYREGDIRIIEARGGDEVGVPVLRIGKDVEFIIPVYASQFFGQYSIFANAEIKNRLERSIKAVYYISFYDDRGEMIGCHQGSWDLEAGGEINYGSAVIASTPRIVESARRYKLRIMVLSDD